MGLIKIVWETIKTFGRNTVIPGLTNAGKAGSYPRLLYWVTIYTVGLVLTFISLNAFISDYLSYPVDTTVELTNRASVTFPAITVCNLNRIHCLNLLNELLRQQDLVGNHSSLAANKTVDTLNELLTKTGCLQQVCLTIAQKVPTTRKVGGNYSEVDDMILNQVDLRCPLNVQYTQVMCYNIKCIRIETNNGTNETVFDISDVDNTWNYWKCSDATVCQFQSAIANTTGIVQPVTNCGSSGGGGGGSSSSSGGGGGSSSGGGGSSSDGGDDGDGGDDSGSQTTSLSGTQVTTAAPTTTTMSTTASITTVSVDTTTNPPTTAGGSEDYPGGGDSSGGGPATPPPPPLQADADSEAKFLQVYMGLDEETKKAIGHRNTSSSSYFGNIKSFISSCTYRGTNCLEKGYWTETVTAGYGNCFIFNSETNTNDPFVPRVSSLTGVNNGFSVELFLDQENYMLDNLSKKAGARIVIHDPTQAALPDEYGLDLQPNTASSIAIQMTEIQRMALPYQPNCTRFWNQTHYNVTESSYSLASCQRYCLQDSIIAACHCYHTTLVQQEQLISLQNISVCYEAPNATNPNYICIQRILGLYDKGNKSCADCQVPCGESQFATSVTTSTWPSNQYWMNLAMSVGYDPGTLQTLNDTQSSAIKAEIQQDFVRADIYYQTLNVESINQKPRYTTSGFFAGLGGSLGLYLGIAIIMCFELLELLFDIGLNVWRNSAPKNKR